MKCDNYIIKPEKGIVVGELDRKKPKNVWDETKILNRGIFKYPSTLIQDMLFTVIDDIDEEYKPFKAVARCQGGDEFSEETGKKIVDLKVNYKYHLAMAKKYRQIIRELKKMLKKIEKLEQKHYNKYQQIDEKLAEFL